MTCNTFGHYAFECPQGKRKGKQHASTTDVDDEDEHMHQRKKTKENEHDSQKEYFFISALTGTITTNSDTWLIDSGASKHMTGYRKALTDLTEKELSIQVELGDNAKYTVKGVGSA